MSSLNESLETKNYHCYCTAVEINIQSTYRSKRVENPGGGYGIFSKKYGKGVHNVKHFKGVYLFVFYFAF